MGLFWGEKEGAVEGTRFEQIKAIESWALSTYQESKKDNPNLDEILENLRKINLQVRKVWSNLMRIDQRWVIKKMPIGIPSGKTKYSMDSTKRMSAAVVYGAQTKEEKIWMEKKLTEMRAAAVVTLRDIKKNKALSKDTKLNIRGMSSLAMEIAGVMAKFERIEPSRHRY